MKFDLIIKGGWVIDGSGGPPFRADVALLEHDRRVGRLDGAEAAQCSTSPIGTSSPGFIDAHVHGDLMLLADPIHLPALKQGSPPTSSARTAARSRRRRPRRWIT